MFSSDIRLRLMDILEKIATGKEVSLNERLYVESFADQDQSIASCLHKAQRLQQNRKSSNEIDQLLDSLELGPNDPHSSYKPKTDDLGEWFSGAPSWLGRS